MGLGTGGEGGWPNQEHHLQCVSMGDGWEPSEAEIQATKRSTWALRQRFSSTLLAPS